MNNQYESVENSKNNLTLSDIENIFEAARNKSRNDEIKTKLYIKNILILLYVIFELILSIINIYIALNDKSCVQISTRNNIHMNLKIYLETNGFFILIFHSLNMFVGLFHTNDSWDLFKKQSPIKIKIIYFFHKIMVLFSISWNIVGGIIFWKYIDNSLCSTFTYNYIYTMLLLGYILQFIDLCYNIRKYYKKL